VPRNFAVLSGSPHGWLTSISPNGAPQVCDGLKMNEVDSATGLAVERELGVADLVKMVEELSLIH
jgi:hypothetical protein